MSTAQIIVQSIADARQKIVEEEAQLDALVDQLRKISKDEDDAIRAGLQESVEKARADHDGLVADLENERARKAAIEAAWNAGDGSTSAAEAAVVETSIARLTGLTSAAERSLGVAREAIKPFLADDHIAYYVADAIQPLTSTPVIIKKRPEDAPALSPAIVLSQTTPADGWGTFTPSGKVAVTIVGDPDLDWRRVARAIEDTGTDATVTERAITLRNMTFTKPILAKPAQHVASDWAKSFCEVWNAHVRQRGFVVDHPQEGKYRVRGTGFASVLSTDLRIEDVGIAVGRVTVAIGIGDVPFLGKEDFAAVGKEALAYYLAEESYTAAGVLVDAQLTDLTASWDQHFETGMLERHPDTFVATIELRYDYEPVEVGD